MERVDRVYFFDLAGASAGCLLLVPFLECLRRAEHGDRGRRAVRRGRRRVAQHGRLVTGRAASVALALALVVFMFLNQTHGFIDVEYAKGQKLPEESFVQVEQLLAHRHGGRQGRPRMA